MCDTADKLNMISSEDMYNRAMAIKNVPSPIMMIL